MRQQLNDTPYRSIAIQTVAEWMAIRYLFEICKGRKGSFRAAGQEWRFEHEPLNYGLTEIAFVKVVTQTEPVEACSVVQGLFNA